VLRRGRSMEPFRVKVWRWEQRRARAAKQIVCDLRDGSSYLPMKKAATGTASGDGDGAGAG
jgi:hypothetical protein